MFESWNARRPAKVSGQEKTSREKLTLGRREDSKGRMNSEILDGKL